MCYCKDLSQYYIHIEDDVRSSPSFVPKLQDLITREKDQFFLIDISLKGNVAKAYHSRDLESAASFFYLMYNEMPIDWLMAHFLRIKVPPRSGRIIIPMASLFLHIGCTSSLALNGVRGNRTLERIFDQYDQKYKGLNPPAIVTSSLSASQGKPQDAYDKGGRNCPPPTTQQQSNTVCFWPREKFISTTEYTRKGNIKREINLSATKHLPKTNCGDHENSNAREHKIKLSTNNNLSQAISKCKLRFQTKF